MRRRSLLTVALVGAVLLAGCAAGPGQGTEPSMESGTIAVTGSGSAEGEPNRAEVEVAVVATADDLTAARDRLARNVTRLREALREAGVADDRITTQRFDLREDRVFREDRPPAVRFRGEHVFRITLTDPDRVGPVIDTAVRNGATEVDEIRFTLSTERRRRLEGAARRSAMADARVKADQLAESANLTVTGVQTVQSLEAGEPRPSGERAAATPVPTAAASPPTDLESGPATVTATVRVVYTVEPAGESESGPTAERP